MPRRRPGTRSIWHGKELRFAFLLVLIGGGAFFVSPEAKTVVSKLDSDLWAESQESAVETAPPPGTEVCEFLARPAAKLYIDGRLACREIPPIYRTELTTGEHTISFVSATNRTCELRIQVVAGSPKRWFMNWVESRVDRRSLER